MELKDSEYGDNINICRMECGVAWVKVGKIKLPPPKVGKKMKGNSWKVIFLFKLGMTLAPLSSWTLFYLIINPLWISPLFFLFLP